MLRDRKKPVLFFFLTLLTVTRLLAQTPAHPKFYFRNPLDIPMKLAANFGELRPDHWHMGLDIRTNAKENLPVHAAAAGYIAHIGVRPNSFGRFIIINHPNGLSTLYAHLNDFYPALEQYVTDQQYQKESWAIELDLTKNQFPVSKGQLIAYSGNTGGSAGPHLHFEIFNTATSERYNPLLYGFAVEDNTPPALLRLALYDRSKSIYEQSPQYFWLKNTDSGYVIPGKPLIRTRLKKISFAIQAVDRMSPGGSNDGIFRAEMMADSQLVSGFRLDSIDYEETLYVNAQMDYREHYNGGPYLQHLSALPGNKCRIYYPANASGILQLEDTLMHPFAITVWDTYNRRSTLSFSVQFDDSLIASAASVSVLPQFIPNQINQLDKPDCRFYLPDLALYDTVPVFYYRSNATQANAVSAAHQLNEASIPLQEKMTVRIRPDRQIPEALKEKLVMQRNWRGDRTVQKVQWQQDWMTGRFGDFGVFQVFHDTIPPVLGDISNNDTADLSAVKQLSLLPSDNFQVIRNFRATLDGEWIRFTNDKGAYFIYVFDERCPFGVHELKVTVEDAVGNATTRTYWFRRNPYTPPPKKKYVQKKKKPVAHHPVKKKK